MVSSAEASFLLRLEVGKSGGLGGEARGETPNVPRETSFSPSQGMVEKNFLFITLHSLSTFYRKKLEIKPGG